MTISKPGQAARAHGPSFRGTPGPDVIAADTDVVLSGHTLGLDNGVRSYAGNDQDYGDVRVVRKLAGSTAPSVTGGDDTIHAGNGIDTIAGDAGTAVDAIIHGGADFIAGENDGDRLYGDVRASTGSTIIGGRDWFEAGLGRDLIAGDLGTGTAARFTGGNDHVNAWYDDDWVYGDAIKLGMTGPAAGRGGSDELHGSAGNDVIVGDVGTLARGRFIGGDDVLQGGRGNDLIIGDFRTVAAGATGIGGDDFLDGGLGNDTMDGGDGTDTAGFQADPLAVTVDLALGTAVGQGTDVLISIENINGSNFGDHLYGDSKANTIIAGSSGDTIDGRGGNDVIVSGSGGDLIAGGAGNDYIDGGAGADKIAGGSGDDTMAGGSGADKFVLELTGGQDVVTDFTDGADRIDARGLGLTLAELTARLDITASGGDTLVTLDAGGPTSTSMLLVGLSPASITIAFDFLI